MHPDFGDEVLLREQLPGDVLDLNTGGLKICLICVWPSFLQNLCSLTLSGSLAAMSLSDCTAALTTGIGIGRSLMEAATLGRNFMMVLMLPR